MIKWMSIVCLAFCVSAVTGCGGESWQCRTKGKSMFSVSDSGKLGSADKGCSCEQMRAFELQEFGSVDEEALKADFGC